MANSVPMNVKNITSMNESCQGNSQVIIGISALEGVGLLHNTLAQSLLRTEHDFQ